MSVLDSDKSYGLKEIKQQDQTQCQARGRIQRRASLTAGLASATSWACWPQTARPIRSQRWNRWARCQADRRSRSIHVCPLPMLRIRLTLCQK